MHSLYSPCDEDSSNIIISNWGRPRFALSSQFEHLMTGFGSHSAAVTSSTTTTTVCPRKAPPPKYNDVVFEILDKHR